MVKASGLAEKWPEAGPKQLWKRELGDGYATVVSDGERLYTMYRVENDEFAVALDAKTGKTVWEQKNASPFTKEMAEFGPGPHATPLIAGAHVYTIGTNAVMHCFEKTTGKIVWMHDLPAEFKAPVPGRGYGQAPSFTRTPSSSWSTASARNPARATPRTNRRKTKSPPPGNL